MKISFLIQSLITASLLLGFASAATPVRNLQDVCELEKKVLDVSKSKLSATVALLSPSTGSSGSGVITTADGLILTAAHVVQGVEEMSVVFADGEQVRGKVLGANFSKDIGMVQITTKGNWPYAEMGTSKPLKAGDPVIAMGHSTGFDANRTPPVRFGSVLSRGPGNFLTTSCTLIGGDSGGPLFDIDGRIVAINSSIGNAHENNNHAGIDGFKEDWDRLRAGEMWGALQMNPLANPDMPVLGIVMGMRRNIRGVLVENIVPNSPAAAAGVRMGDVIVSIDESEIRDSNKLLQVLLKRQAGDRVTLGISRDQKSRKVEVILGRRESLFE